MNKYIVELIQRRGLYGREIDHGLVHGLREELFGGGESPDHWLLVSSIFCPNMQYKFWGGLFDTPTDSLYDALHIALYDLYQVSDILKEGDTFDCSFEGYHWKFRCDGVHVIPA